MAIIKSFRKLRVYQQARTEANKVFQLTKSFPRDERFSLTDQIRRRPRAVKSTVAEAWGHWRYPTAFGSKLTDAIGEANEAKSWLDDALDCGDLKSEAPQALDAAWQTIGASLQKIIERADEFCRNAK